MPFAVALGGKIYRRISRLLVNCSPSGLLPTVSVSQIAPWRGKGATSAWADAAEVTTELRAHRA